MALANHNLSTLDFQASDDAWYAVNLVLHGEMLIVKYLNFSDEFDEKFIAADFKDPNKLAGFLKRFRPTSSQLQDNECKKIIEGKTVCASFEFGKDDVRFYDAVVEEVNYKDHVFGKEELCTCEFVLFWLEGPNAGNKTVSTVAQICLLQVGNAQMDKTLSRFQEMCREKSKTRSRNSGSASKGGNSVGRTSRIGSIVVDKTTSPSSEPHAHYTKEVQSCKHLVSTSRKLKKQKIDHLEWSGQYIDLEENSDFVADSKETSSFHFILIENLEKELPPLAIVDFVKKHLDIACQAQVFPCLSSEIYTRGIIIVDTQDELQKLSDFLHNDAYMILSSNGRPWVITEKTFCRGAVGAKVRNLTMLSESGTSDKSLESGEKIRIVSRGTGEYDKGKKFKDMFLQFTDRQRQLQKQLAFGEHEILLSSNATSKQP